MGIKEYGECSCSGCRVVLGRPSGLCAACTDAGAHSHCPLCGENHLWGRAQSVEEPPVETRQQKIARLAQPDAFSVRVTFAWPVYRELTTTEGGRLARQLDLVERIAARLAANMLKGVLKYPEPPATPAAWLEYLKDDAADALNYVWLLGEAMQTEKGGR